MDVGQVHDAKGEFAVHHPAGSKTMDGGQLYPEPTDIRRQMPGLAAWLEDWEREFPGAARDALRAGGAIRKALLADDFELVSAIYASGRGWAWWREGGFEWGIDPEIVRAFAQRHRARRAAKATGEGG